MPDRNDRVAAAFLGLALGDAYGRPLEFERGERARTTAVRIDASFAFTDDTWMALYLADAVRAHGPGPLDDDRFGRATGEAFVAWSRDPTTPGTAPGMTCLRGAAEFARSGDWRTSGVRESDGCGAVMRIAPLPMRFAGDELDRAAMISALVTHAHPNAPAAAAALGRLTRALLDGSALTATLVRAVADDAEVRDPSAPAVAAALRAAAELGGRRGARWLDERAIPEGDGGWRSPSAVGLAVAAALAWGDDVATAIDRAARIDGDSDSVACLTGMLLGAARGTAALPVEWLAVLPERARIERVARELGG